MKMLTKEQEAIVKEAKTKKRFARNIKKQIAKKYNLPGHEHVSIEKAFEYENYLESPSGKLDKFLDTLGR